MRTLSYIKQFLSICSMLFVAQAQLVAQVPGDENWDSGFGVGIGNNNDFDVLAVAVSGSDVYVGGYFSVEGGGPGNSIAKWNGSTWSALGGGVSLSTLDYDPRVNVIVVNGNDVYVGGMFDSAGGTSANNIAKWNGSSWSALGTGVSSVNDVASVTAIAVSGNEIYVAGEFEMAGGVSANNIAKWNDSSWSALGSGTDGRIEALAVNGSELCAGGFFSIAGGVSANKIAKWNGSNWSALGSGVSHPLGSSVHAVELSGSDVYVGGLFDTAGGASANNIAKWNGDSWSALSSGVNSVNFLSFVNAIAVNGSDVYVGGRFETAGSVNANNIARWDGSSWAPLGTGTADHSMGYYVVNAIALSGNDIYAGGSISIAGYASANGIAKWDGNSWLVLGNGLDGPVYAIAVRENEVFVGGKFTSAGSVSVNNIARWDGNSWSAMGSGVDGPVYAIAVTQAYHVGGEAVYVGGGFTSAGGISANSIAKWDGNQWSALGSGVNYYGSETTVNAITVLSTSVLGEGIGHVEFVGGIFSNAGGVNANHIAEFDGEDWSALDDGSYNGVLGPGVWSLLPQQIATDDRVVVGGTFLRAGGVEAHGIAIWHRNTSEWSPLGNGLTNPDLPDSRVLALAGGSSHVYAGGMFQIASSYNVAEWNGFDWSALDDGVGGTDIRDMPVNAIALNGNVVYVGGEISVGDGGNGIVSWEDNSWSALGSGVNGSVNAIAVSDSNVYVGGDFTTAGKKLSNYFGLWHAGTPVPVELAFFSAARTNNGVLLTWQTMSETNNFGFAVQKSTDSETFTDIGFVQGHGTSASLQSFKFFDEGLTPGIAYYRLAQIDTDGAVTLSAVVRVENPVPQDFVLAQNYPNPFNPETKINYQLPKSSKVRISVFNLLGQKVTTLVDTEKPAGYYSIKWDGKDESGRLVLSGMYIYQIETDEFVKVKKLVLIH
jgi:hypothetical protein